MTDRLKVVQWTTGKTGGAAVRGMAGHPVLDLVGCYAYTKDKVGRDVGELCGIGPLGITATDDIDALLALEPDCVSYMPYLITRQDGVWRHVELGIRKLRRTWQRTDILGFGRREHKPHSGHRARLRNIEVKTGVGMGRAQDDRVQRLAWHSISDIVAAAAQQWVVFLA